jgi:hypothetical protein
MLAFYLAFSHPEQNNFHLFKNPSGGILAHSTPNLIECCRKYAEKAGISTKYAWVLDSVSEEIQKISL